MRQDVIRFIYEREKLRLHGLPADDLSPYPGRLLSDDLIFSALEALRALSTPEMMKRFGTPEEIILSSQNYAQAKASQYSTFEKYWKKAINILKGQRLKQEFYQLIKKML